MDVGAESSYFILGGLYMVLHGDHVVDLIETVPLGCKIFFLCKADHYVCGGNP